METVRGKICAIEDRHITVEVRSAISCKRCAAGNGCGAGIFQSSNNMREIRLKKPDGLSVGVGDVVELSIESREVLRAAAVAYGFPLLSMLLTLAFVQALPVSIGDPAAVSLALLGLMLGVFVGRRFLSNDSVCTQFVPIVSGQVDRCND